MNKRKFGKSGETLAADFLEQLGHRILEKNYWCRIGEIDLITQKGDCVHFVEVKTRTGTFYGSPSESVTGNKRHKIQMAAENYMKCMQGMPGLGKKMQMDLIEIELTYTAGI